VSPARRLVAPPVRAVARALVRARTARWEPRSHLIPVSDAAGWVLAGEAAALAGSASRLGVQLGSPNVARFGRGQSVFHTSHFDGLSPFWMSSGHALGVSYFHGRPGSVGMPEFDRTYEAIRRDPGRVDRFQITHEEMRDVVVSAGVDPARVFKIPIGIELERFPLGGLAEREAARKALGLPETAFVVGSFQKDGVGWGEGLAPKLVKGPDVLVAALEEIRSGAPELVVLLTGPARGYVCDELRRREIPFVHVNAAGLDEVARAYHALDLYVVSSRQEGGPKAVLESFATGVPLVSTRVGQGQELVEHDVNGAMVEVDDAAALAAWGLRVRDDSALRARWRSAGRPVAEANAYQELDPLWAELFDGFVAVPESVDAG
jgi:glycosyltransferase involved in cell wall biosynthesis